MFTGLIFKIVGPIIIGALLLGGWQVYKYRIGKEAVEKARAKSIEHERKGLAKADKEASKIERDYRKYKAKHPVKGDLPAEDKLNNLFGGFKKK